MKICKHCSKKFSKFADIDKHENACWNNPFNRSYCECCGEVVKHKGKYCNESCAATINNSNRRHSKDTKEKIRISINKHYNTDPRYRNADYKKKYKLFVKKVQRYSRQQLKTHMPELYKYWQSNPYKSDGDTSKLSIEHITPIKYFYDNKLSVQEAGDISNLEIIPYSLNRKRQQEYLLANS